MKKVSIISRVDVCYDEADIIRLITAEIEADNPSVQVNSVVLERKLNPPRISVVVDAAVRGTVSTEVQGELDLEAPVATNEPEEASATVADIFGED